MRMEMGRMKKKFGVVDSGGEVRERGVDGMVGGIEEDEGGHDDRWDGVMRKKRLCRSDGSFLTSKKKTDASRPSGEWRAVFQHEFRSVGGGIRPDKDFPL